MHKEKSSSTPLSHNIGLNQICTLVDWFIRNRRVFPWRETRNPYHIWVSEVLLQQTRARTAIPYYNRFIERFPKLEDLANAPTEEVLKYWEGLGYYSRAKNLQRGAQALLAMGGDFPLNRKALLKIPGIGPYTAGAVLSFAFGQPVAAVDGNVVRVLSRFLLQPWILSRARDREEVRLWIENSCYTADHLQEMQTYLQSQPSSCNRSERVEHTYPHLLNEALIELGALICTPRNPNCIQCPWQSSCQAYQLDKTTEFPLASIKSELPIDHRTVLSITQPHRAAVLVQPRPAEGLLAGLWEFYVIEDGLESSASVEDYLLSCAVTSLQVKENGLRKHVFSHRKWILHCYEVSVQNLELACHALREARLGSGREPILATPETLLKLPLCGAYLRTRDALLMHWGTAPAKLNQIDTAGVVSDKLDNSGTRRKPRTKIGDRDSFLANGRSHGSEDRSEPLREAKGSNSAD